MCAGKEHKISVSETGYVDIFASVRGFNKLPISKKSEVRIYHPLRLKWSHGLTLDYSRDDHSPLRK